MHKAYMSIKIALLLMMLIPLSQASTAVNTQIHELAYSVNKAKLPIEDTYVVAHRGASGYAPENTLEAFALAKKMEADFIELDIQRTKDGTLIVLHDKLVDRTTNGEGKVKDLSLHDIQQLDAGSWFNEKYPKYAKKEYVGAKVPTLEQVFETFGNSIQYIIELKSPHLYPKMEMELLNLLEKYQIEDDHIIIQSFDEKCLVNIHKQNANIPLFQLLKRPNTDEQQLKLIKKYAVGVGPNFKRINEDYVRKAKSFQLYIHPYTLNDEFEIETALNWGVSGIITNYPDKVKRKLSDKK
ncbi:glycerophosphoryl diester phosphodiesterase [Evansella cellulosilytica DSM 2522]|uniref:Glycerophosphoryl diester phosphodiesterase n=1 Tax=Evansella cellulosilytica (strain ATCC 21833 / DSM 2522 / FERM P-1141 / JCM 9156 / N-4) TaxID=649639 RepID=E6TZ18_EVAC2|nr:glycerophosphodiester phosphodiesterase [Evansella cellulosilytica]ADU32461.1 glycerophosphoryl diester phosphodiesterase [Evansella cellulosilytica DSM 2522]